MDTEHHTLVYETVTTELVLVARFLALTRQFQALVGTPAQRRRQDPAALAALDAQLRALTEQAKVLHEELAAVDRAYRAGTAPAAPPTATGELLPSPDDRPPAAARTGPTASSAPTAG